jgi:hypothetical protein
LQDIQKVPLTNSIKRKTFAPIDEEKEHDFNVFLKDDKSKFVDSPEIAKKEVKVEQAQAKAKWESLPQLTVPMKWGRSTSTTNFKAPTTLQNLAKVEGDDIILLDKEPAQKEGNIFQRLGTQKLTEEPKLNSSPIKISENPFQYVRENFDAADDDIKVDRSSLPSLSRRTGMDSLPALKKRNFSKPKVTEIQRVEENDVIYLNPTASLGESSPVMLDKPVEAPKVEKDIIDIISQFRSENDNMMKQMKKNALSRYDRFGRLRDQSQPPTNPTD